MDVWTNICYFSKYNISPNTLNKVNMTSQGNKNVVQEFCEYRKDMCTGMHDNNPRAYKII